MKSTKLKIDRWKTGNGNLLDLTNIFNEGEKGLGETMISRKILEREIYMAPGSIETKPDRRVPFVEEQEMFRGMKKSNGRVAA